MPELTIYLWLKEPTVNTCITWDGLIGTQKEIDKYKEHLKSWMVDWTPGNLIEIETDNITYFIKYDDIQLVEMNVKELI